MRSAVATAGPPSPPRGLCGDDFRPIALGGLGDPRNSYPHSMAWFRDHLYIGTTRANLCMLKASKSIKSGIQVWPIECPDYLYDLDMRAQIWRYDPRTGVWTEVYRSPIVRGSDGRPVPRDMGYRCMTVFQGASDPEPALYVGSYAPAKAIGTQILRSLDGISFAPAAKPAEWDNTFTSLRILVPFKDRLFAAPTGRAYSNPNASIATVFETRDPLRGPWRPASEPDLGDPNNFGIFEMLGTDEYLYAGAANLNGYQLWRTTGAGNPPYRWERILVDGAYRGRHNQIAVCLHVFKDDLYVGGGIQSGGIDLVNKIGPAAPELVRVRKDGSWDLIVGVARDTPDGRKEPLSGFLPGFNNPFNGYFWRLGSHDGWLYQGTYDWSVLLPFGNRGPWPPLFANILTRLGDAAVLANLGGADLYRSYDGENWVPVTTSGFDNPYNFGFRTIVSTPYGLAVGACNPFGPRVARHDADGWDYHHNPRGGAEVWLGTRPIGSEGSLG